MIIDFVKLQKLQILNKIVNINLFQNM